MIEIQVGALLEAAEPCAAIVEEAAALTLAARGVEEAELSITMTGDGAIRALNRDHLDHDWPTDVISFALYQGEDEVLGDIYLGFEQAVRQAAAEGVSIEEEIARLTIHGTLHILGLDHPEDADADERADSEMYRIQEEIVREWVALRTGAGQKVGASGGAQISQGGQDG